MIDKSTMYQGCMTVEPASEDERSRSFWKAFIKAISVIAVLTFAVCSFVCMMRMTIRGAVRQELKCFQTELVATLETMLEKKEMVYLSVERPLVSLCPRNNMIIIDFPGEDFDDMIRMSKLEN